MRRRTFLLACIGVPLVPRVWANEATKSGSPAISLGGAINKAGRQRMLSQRMAKAFALQTLGIMPEKAGAWLDQSRRLFEAQLAELKTLTPSDAIRNGIADLEKAWGSYRLALGRDRNAENGRAVLAESENTLRLAHQLTGLYEKQSSGNTGRLVNVSGRQRMLSQRMAKCFLFQQAGLASAALATELDGARRDFVAAMAELNGAAENTPDIRSGLVLANTQWLFFEQALVGQEPIRETAARNVATTSERILEVMDELTGRYEGLLRG